MEITSYTAFRNNLAAMMDKVNDDNVPVLITRQNGTPAVLVSYEYYKKLTRAD
jgi:antitoxin YefM